MNPKTIAPSNYQDLLKTIAIICMIIDHIALFLFPQIIELRIIGRISVPIFAFFAGYNFKNKPQIRILLYGLLITLVEGMNFHVFGNILLSLYLGQYVLYIIEIYKLNNNPLYFLIICLLCVLLTPLTYGIIDSGTLVPGFIIIGKLYHDQKPNPEYMILLALSYILMIITIFPFPFSQGIITSLLILLTCYTLSSSVHSKKISIDLRFISRNVLMIYFVHIVALIIIASNIPLVLHLYNNYLKV